MKIEILSVRNPQWANKERTLIDCLVRTNILKHEVPFTASANDPEVHGREIFSRCFAGEFGEVGVMSPNQQQQLLPEVEPLSGCYPLGGFLVEANKENSRRSFRSVVIVWSSALEDLLGQILEAEISRAALTAGETIGRPPQKFAAQIKLAFKLGLIDQEEANRCDHIRKIRNAVAHNWDLTLSTKDVLPSLRALYEADHSQQLIFHEDLQFLLQQVYSASCSIQVMKCINRLSKKTG